MVRFDKITKNKPSCELSSTSVNILAGEWKCAILSNLLVGSMKIEELYADVPLMDRALLVQQLAQLEHAELVERLAGSDNDYRHEYAITPLGRTLEPILLAMQSWGERYYACRQHGACIDPVRIYE